MALGALPFGARMPWAAFAAEAGLAVARPSCGTALGSKSYCSANATIRTARKALYYGRFRTATNRYSVAGFVAAEAVHGAGPRHERHALARGVGESSGAQRCSWVLAAKQGRDGVY